MTLSQKVENTVWEEREREGGRGGREVGKGREREVIFLLSVNIKPAVFKSRNIRILLCAHSRLARVDLRRTRKRTLMVTPC